MRDLPYSDCCRRSIACSRRGSHGNAVLRFFKIAINPRFNDIKKQVEQGSTCLFCGGDAGFALQRLLPKVNRVQPKGFTRQCRVAIFQNRNKSPLQRYKKTSRTGFNLSFLWWRCGICLTAIAAEGQSRAAEGVHTAMPCCDFSKSQ